LTIQIDTREKPRAIKKILAAFDAEHVDYFVSKLYVGDYQSYDNPYLIVDRKQNLTELCSNVTQGHERFRRELLRAQEHGIQLVILCEHGNGIRDLEDVIFWENPRRKRRKKVSGKWQTITTKATSGETLYKILLTLSRKYGVRFEFCDKAETGRRIMEILKDDC
jgi:ERCC4-type nuclease